MKKLISKYRRPKETSTTQLHRLPNLTDIINNFNFPPPSSSPPIHPTQVSTSSGHNGMPLQVVELLQQRRRGHRITSTATFGTDHTFKQVSDFLIHEDVVGIYGMGGVGKTTLMRRIHQEFLQPQGFHVIWITVSKTIHVDKFQQYFMKGMGLEFDPTEEPCKRARRIRRKLEKEVGKVALLLDDIWEFVDLEEVLGPVELDPSIFKIVFTTRLKEVCELMKPHKEIKMKCLGWDDSWALFEREAIYDCDFRIAEVAKDIAGFPGRVPAGSQGGYSPRSPSSQSTYRGQTPHQDVVHAFDPEVIMRRLELIEERIQLLTFVVDPTHIQSVVRDIMQGDMQTMLGEVIDHVTRHMGSNIVVDVAQRFSDIVTEKLSARFISELRASEERQKKQRIMENRARDNSLFNALKINVRPNQEDSQDDDTQPPPDSTR